MSLMTRKRNMLRPQRAMGFTLIEVMIAILVLGFGLLGFALLQTMSVRFAQSANFRTQATNLSYGLLDRIRVDRANLANYVVGEVEGTTAAADCQPKTDKSVSAADYMKDWRCQLGKALGDDAKATVARAGNVVTVSVSWGDERWNKDAEATTFSVETTL